MSEGQNGAARFRGPGRLGRRGAYVIASGVKVVASIGDAIGGDEWPGIMGGRRSDCIPTRATPRASSLRSFQETQQISWGSTQAPDAFLKLIVPVRGQAGAPMRRWSRAVDVSKYSGLKQHPLDPCVSAIYDKGDNCDGFMLLRG